MCSPSSSYEKLFKKLIFFNPILVDHCVTNLDSKLYTIVIFFDLSKAFGTVNRDLMLDKLKNIGIRGIANKWFFKLPE